MKAIKILTIIAVINLISFGCASNQSPSNSTVRSNAANQSSKANQPVQNEQPSTQEKAITITAAQLSKEYKENEQAADAKYDGKTLEVSGKVESIGGLNYDTVFLVAEHLRVSCLTQGSEVDKVEQIRKGQDVTVIGIGMDNPAFGSIGIGQCRIK